MTDDALSISPAYREDAADETNAGLLSARRRFSTAAITLLLAAAYAFGLVRQIDEPWIGLHDWNGAFYSQLARNLVRYPFNVHHGMPLVAVGDDAPPEERSIYATHPAGVVWVVAAAFGLGGESEEIARLAAICASLMTLTLWVGMMRRACGRETAIVGGLVYAVMPMSVYFGRMVNHEAFCLLGMMVALLAWQFIEAPTQRTRRWTICFCTGGLILGIMIDWVGVLFAALLCIHAAWRWRRGSPMGAVAVIWAASILGTAAMVLHLVYGGLEGRWLDLWAIFFSRSASVEIEAVDSFRHNTVENLTLPIILMGALGLACGWRAMTRSKYTPHQGTPPSSPSPALRADIVGGWTLTATGLIWLVLFLRQYQIHQYWMFYLGPVIALWAARGILALRDILRGLGPLVSHGVAAAWILWIILASQNGIADLYAQRHASPEFIRACQRLRDETPVGQVVQLPREHIAIETFGRYQFRNIVPPQLAYYLDRPFVVRMEPANPLENGNR